MYLIEGNKAFVTLNGETIKEELQTKAILTDTKTELIVSAFYNKPIFEHIQTKYMGKTLEVEVVGINKYMAMLYEMSYTSKVGDIVEMELRFIVIKVVD